MFNGTGIAIVFGYFVIINLKRRGPNQPQKTLGQDVVVFATFLQAGFSLGTLREPWPNHNEMKNIRWYHDDDVALPTACLKTISKDRCGARKDNPPPCNGYPVPVSSISSHPDDVT
jgi:hypothetical protein